ncbi:hypothetical protein PFHG_01602 [Plasmodium falciparum HB3]|uniref:Uncharacterized protein n=1 Tax=Plasmodium falciparum (isolate HB3) TaxID=137071 RepID=A0A0L7KA00_PLAFX|nr:hypothetical protein PFHG_01602 [Plasmodium falciparum HB3]
MPLNVITPSEPKDPSLIYKYKKKEEYSGELEGIIVLCFLAIFFAVIFKGIEGNFCGYFYLAFNILNSTKWRDEPVVCITTINDAYDYICNDMVSTKKYDKKTVQ